jgi:hypothetical protein
VSVQTLPDGSLEIRESFRILRLLCLACALIALLLFILMFGGGYGESAKAGWAALGVAVLCLAGMVVNDRSFRFDATSRMVTWRQENLFRAKHGRIPFADVRDVVVVGERSRDHDNAVGGYATKYGAALVTAAGNIPLSSHHSRREQDFRELAERVREVLGMPMQSQEDEAARLVAAGRMIDAVALIRKRDGVDLATARAAAERLRPKNQTTSETQTR